MGAKSHLIKTDTVSCYVAFYRALRKGLNIACRRQRSHVLIVLGAPNQIRIQTGLNVSDALWTTPAGFFWAGADGVARNIENQGMRRNLPRRKAGYCH
jgi:ethanolamine utilization microcompartment shell protein EutL